MGGIETDDFLELIGEFRVVGDLERAHPMRLKPLPHPDAPHRGRADPTALAIAGALQWVASCGGAWLVNAMTDRRSWTAAVRSATAGSCRGSTVVHEALLPAPSRSFLSLRQAPQMALVPLPSAVNRTIRGRQTCFCGLFLK